MVIARDLPAVLTKADHVNDILPDTPASRGFVNDELFSRMKHGAVFHNIGCGTIVDQDSFVCALRSGLLSAAWLDVTDPEPLPSDHPLRHESHCFMPPTSPAATTPKTKRWCVISWKTSAASSPTSHSWIGSCEVSAYDQSPFAARWSTI